MKPLSEEPFKHSKIPIPLDFKAFTTLPDSHAWEPETPPNDPKPNPSVPEISLLDPTAGARVRRACEQWGVFQVSNHGVPAELLWRVEHQTRRLFALPTERKLRAARPPGGLAGYGMVRISAFFPKLMWSEGFSIVGSPAEHAHKLWPHHDHHHHHHHDHDGDDHDQCYYFCDVMETYQKEMKALSEKIMDLMIGSLGLNQEDSKWAKPKTSGPIKDFQALLQLNSYPVCPDPTRGMGMAPHTDSSLLTVLHQSSNVSGLQVYRAGIGWVPVHPIEGALVVNVGDLMHILTNGRFKSVLHRAVVSGTHERFSSAYFYGPPKDVEVSPLVDPPLYRAVTWKDYLHAKAIHFANALESIKNG